MFKGVIAMIYPIYDTWMQINDLAKKCNDMECELIEQMIHNAADYVRAVIIMETAASNIASLDSDGTREAKQSTDRARTIAHDAFISSVNIVNRICDKHEFRRIYTDGEDRRDYGEFALRIVRDIFASRH